MRYLFFLCCFFTSSLSAQLLLPVRAVVPAGEESTSKQFRDPFAAFQNPAALCGQPSAIALRSERAFLLKELALFQLQAVWAQEHAALGLQLQSLGYSAWRSYSAGLQYARELGQVEIGIAIQYTGLPAGADGTDGTVHTAAGILFPVSPSLVSGIRVSNFLGGRLLKAPAYRLARELEWSWGYTVSEAVWMGMALLKTEGRPIRISAQLVYQPVKNLLAKAGMNSQTRSPWAGAGWQKGQLQVFAACALHPEAGLTPSLHLICSFKKVAE